MTTASTKKKATDYPRRKCTSCYKTKSIHKSYTNCTSCRDLGITDRAVKALCLNGLSAQGMAGVTAAWEAKV